MNPENHYTERLSLTEGQLQQVKKQIFRISMLRLALFIAGIAGLYFFFNQTTLLIICICLTFLPLFILVKIHNRFFIRKEWLETQARIIQEELQALSGDYSSFEDGLVDEDDYRGISHAAHLHEFAGLCLHTLGRVNHDDG